MKKLIISFCCIVSFLIGIFCACVFIYINGIKATSKDSKIVEFEIKEGSNYYSIASDLYAAGLIKSELCYKIYLKLNKVPNHINIGIYQLRKNMNVKELIETLSLDSYNPNIVKITFKEGFNFYDIIDSIIVNTNNTEEDIMSLINNEDYLNSLIAKYWFMTDEIKNSDIYYPLEGYLYPNTYQFKNKDVSVEEIFKVMLDDMDKKLTKYKDQINESQYTVHEILTLASIVELEGAKKEDRAMISGVFYNRLAANMNLGSDVTAYYGAKVRLSERDLYTSELESDNAYNTRNSKMIGRLPVGPICNASIEAIQSVLEPTQSDYYYFVADKNKQVYYTKSSTEHLEKIAELKKAGLWYMYE